MHAAALSALIHVCDHVCTVIRASQYVYAGCVFWLQIRKLYMQLGGRIGRLATAQTSTYPAKRHAGIAALKKIHGAKAMTMYHSSHRAQQQPQSQAAAC